MPIRFDRYDIPRGGLPGAPSPRVPKPDTTAADALAVISQAAQSAVTPLAKAHEKKALLAEKVRVGERYLTASEEMDRQLIAIEQDDKLRENAEEHFGKWLQERSQTWLEGLSPEGSAALAEKLVDKRYSAGHRARMIEVTDLQARTNTVILGHAKKFVDTYARTGPEVIEYEADAQGRVRIKETREFRDLQEAYGHAVASGAKTRDAAAKELLSHKQEGAAAKAHAMILDVNPMRLRQLKDAIAQEEQKPGSTFLGVLDADRRNAIKKQAYDESYIQLKRQQEQIDRARAENERALKQGQEDWERRSDTMLTNRTLTEAWIEDGKKYGLASDEKARFYRTALEKQRTGEEGPNHADTFRRLAPLVYSEASNPREVLYEVQSAFSDGRLNYPTAIEKWAAHLTSRIERDKTRGTTPEERALKDEKSDVEKWIGILTTTRSPFEKFDPAANRLKLRLLEELGKLPAGESPKAWYFKNQVQFFGEMRGLAAGYIRTERAALHVPVDGVPPEGTNVADVVASRKAEYVAKYGANWKAHMVEDVERLQRMQELQAEIDSKKPDGGGTPGPKPSTPSISAPSAEKKPAISAPSAEKKPAISAPAKKPGGPLKSGSRAYSN